MKIRGTTGAMGLGLALGFLGQAQAEVPATVDPAVLPNYHLIRPGLAASGTPSPQGLAELKAMGFKTVIDLRTEKEGTKEEEAVVKAAGLSYTSIPVTAETLSPADVAAVAKILDDPATGPVLLHCASANRVGAVWALLRMQKGATREEAEAEGKAVGLKSPVLIEAVRKLAPAKP